MEKRFLADVMLGRLARWLRILGYDTLYTRKRIDSLLEVRAYDEGRIILTRDSRLYRKLGPERSFFIHADDFRDQMEELIRSLDMHHDPDRFLSRCLDCNHPLVPIAKEDVRMVVPPFVFQTVEAFRTCPQCKKVFWPGTHIGEMERLITTLFERKGTEE
ncbi:MAG: Mut7-C RNAse domain-containing protein [bacterium]